VLVGLAVGLLLSLALQGSSDFPDALVPRVLGVSGWCLGEGLKRPCFGDETVDFLFDSGDELISVWSAECLGCLDFLCVAYVVC